jgi:hypothetical protein
MENLITLLLHLVQKVPYLSEVEHEGELALLRTVEAHLGVSGIVPPATGVTNPPAPAPAVPVPGPVAEPVPADSTEAQTPPPTSPDVVAPPEVSNAFSGFVGDLSPEQRSQLEAALGAGA